MITPAQHAEIRRLYYAEHWSLWLDIKVMLRTIPAVLAGRGAYSVSYTHLTLPTTERV